MEPSTRNALIVLLIVAPLFIAVVLWGLLKHDASPDGNDRQKANSAPTPSFFDGIGKVFSSLKRSIKFPQDTFRVPAHGQLGPISVPPAKSASDKFRSAKFRLLVNQGVPIATLDYRDIAAASDETYKDLAQQSIDFPAPSSEEKRRREDPHGMIGSIVALKGGGTLTMRCNSAVPCTFELVR